ncbi:MAG TPA: HDIG domain-containing protein [Candidatus Limnocylindria bacterium]|nr:HDIG domain-containing protein [Candidatus Limnocylindria bacterium]
MIRFAPRTRSVADVRALIQADPRVRMAAFVIATGLLSAVALLFSPPAVVSYGQTGVVADREVRAPHSTAFTSETLSQIERDKAAAAVQRVYAADPAVIVASSSHLQAALTGIARVRGDATLPRDQRIAALTKLSEVTLTVPLATDALDMTAAEFDALTKELDTALKTLYQQGIRPEQLDAQRADTAKALPPAWTDRQKRIGAELLKQSLQANLSFDATATVTLQQAARNNVAPVQVQVTAGEVVVREGQVVTEQDLEKLRALGLVNPGIDWKSAIGLLSWALLIAGVLALFVERYAQEAWSDDRKLMVVALSLVVITAAGRALIPGHTVAVYFVPFAAVAMMLTILVGGRTALATQIVGALHVGIMSGQVELVAYVLVPALLGMAAVRQATTAREFVAAALYVALGDLGVIGTFLLVGRSADTLGALQLAAAALISGVASGVLAFGAIVMLGHLFRITTVFELRELADPNHPLLRQLLLRTPGTYHHSLLVANLSERAAEVIGADPLVARVGAYYHDVGKMRNPLAFIENQTGTNPHDELDPAVSASIVSAHVRDGLALADRYRLPPQIREIIPGHHGTSLIRFFHTLALQRGMAVDEAAFRHPGPKPRSKEAGIVMLADGTEAAVRSLEEKTPEQISEMVERIVGEKVADGQLDDCDLTLRDVQRVKEAFRELLAGVYHERIPYPEDRIARLPPASTPPTSASGT